jgi:hypothetical protein
MQIKETPDVSFPGVVESPPLEDVVVLADGTGVALGVQRAHSAQGCGASAMTAAASSRSGAWRYASSGATARSPGSCAGRSDTRGVFNRLDASAMDKIVQAASGLLSSIKTKQGSAACSVSRSNLSRD